MTTLGPNQLRQNILTARAEIDSVRQLLLAHESERHLALGHECVRTAQSLGQLLDGQSVPHEYRVAVVGRFKAGKSFFVNELLGRKLAGEETNPETAAVTTFRHGQRVQARVHFLPLEQWSELKRLHAVNPKDPDVQRLANWSRFPTRKPDDDAKEHFDEAKLAVLETEFIVPGGRFEDLALDDPSDTKKASAFRKALKQFTTGTRPHHCLVERIEITAPSPLLEQGVLLIDTPGLDDPERFRVNLTQDVVKDVDAVLFLTKSGASYGQTEKDFILSLLRRGSIKQLVFVVTQIDHTYSQHLEQAEGDDEEAESISRRVEQERRRLRSQIDATLSELAEGGTDSPAMERYREQLGEVEIIFTSAINHRKAKDGKTVDHPLDVLDPGGMAYVERKLMEILSTESRLAQVARALRAGAAVEIEQMLRLIGARRHAVHGVEDKEVAEQKLGAYRIAFETAASAFTRKVNADVAVLKRTVEGGEKLNLARIESIVLAADIFLREFETEDAARYWSTRRSGKWGHMRGLQSSVANGIFPKVAALLEEEQAEFSSFVEKFKSHLNALGEESAQISHKLQVGAEIRINVAARLEEFLDRTLHALQELIDTEQARIVHLLDEFVTENVEERIAAARVAVSDVAGVGTTAEQTRMVRNFYELVRPILRNALENHLVSRIRAHGTILTGKAEELPDKALTEVTVEFGRIAANIKAAAEAASTGQKAAFEAAATALVEVLQRSLSTLGELFEAPLTDNGKLFVLSEAAPATAEPMPNHLAPGVVLQAPPPTATPFVPTASTEIDWSAIQADATCLLRRINLRAGDLNWAWGRLFAANLVQGANSALLIDPYLDRRHQRRNLGEVAQLLHRLGPVTRLSVITGKRDEMEAAEGDSQLRELATQLASIGIDLSWARDSTQHDRRLLLSNGVVFELGMGLDIYAPTRNLTETNPSLRKIRKATTINVLLPAGGNEAIV
jgi:signal recognition particle receptor subunit beta